MKNKAVVIYHSADYDGIFCREIARKFLPDAEFIGWDFADPPIGWAKIQGKEVVVMDLPCDKPFGATFPEDVTKTLDVQGRIYGTASMVWIDHHKSAIDSHPSSIPGYRIDGVAACRLAWQWFTHDIANNVMSDPAYLPKMGEFVDRFVKEPIAVRLAGEYDIWDKRDPRAETFQYALRCSNQEDESLQSLLELGTEPLIEEMLKLGSAAQYYAQRTDASICKHKTWLMEWEGLKFLCVNSARFNSLLFAAKDVPETGHDALMGFCFNGKQWTVSLYHAAHRKDLDLSRIATKYGGGGHRGACGFTCAKIPFPI